MTRARLASGAVVVLLAAAGGGAALAVTSGADPGDRNPEARATSYCDAALAVAHTDPQSADRVAARLDRALALAPSTKARAAIRAMRSAANGSDEYTAAQARFTTFNTNHCCGCIGSGDPVVAAVEPSTTR